MSKEIKLSMEQYTKLLEAERNLNSVHTEFDKMEDCGIDCQQMRGAVQMQLQQIEALKMHYGPKRVPSA